MVPKGKKLTDSMWGLAIAGLLAYEIYTLTNDEPEDTLSEGVWRATARQPLVPFLGGLLAGHFFWQSTSKYEEIREGE